MSLRAQPAGPREPPVHLSSAASMAAHGCTQLLTTWVLGTELKPSCLHSTSHAVSEAPTLDLCPKSTPPHAAHPGPQLFGISSIFFLRRIFCPYPYGGKPLISFALNPPIWRLHSWAHFQLPGLSWERSRKALTSPLQERGRWRGRGWVRDWWSRTRGSHTHQAGPPQGQLRQVCLLGLHSLSHEAVKRLPPGAQHRAAYPLWPACLQWGVTETGGHTRPRGTSAVEGETHRGQSDTVETVQG